MSKQSDLRKKRKETERMIKLALNVFAIVFSFAILVVTIYYTVKIYNPKQRNMVEKSNYVYRKIQTELSEIYKEQGFLFTGDKNYPDSFCTVLSQKFSKKGADCADTGGNYKKNFTFLNTSVEVRGLEKPPYKLGGTYVKDFFIDVNGEKGENTIGVDRIPLRMYSTGRTGGLLTPVNCSKDESRDFDFDYPSICAGGLEIKFMATNIPFGYDVHQIGGDKGKTRALNRDIPFLRADCIAFGGEMVAYDDYCDARGYPWLQACYDEFPCAVELSKSKL